MMIRTERSLLVLIGSRHERFNLFARIVLGIRQIDQNGHFDLKVPNRATPQAGASIGGFGELRFEDLAQS